MITIDSNLTIHLRNRHQSYGMHVVDGRFLAHLYWGPPLSVLEPATLLRPRNTPYLAAIERPAGAGEGSRNFYHQGATEAGREGNVGDGQSPGEEGSLREGGESAIDAPEAERSPSFSLDLLPQEYPAWGTGEQREGAFRVILADGSEPSRLEYVEHEVLPGAVQPELMELLREDHTLGVVETLRVRLGDPRGDLLVDLFYLVAEDAPGILRWARFSNAGAGAITLLDPAAASVDLSPEKRDFVRLAGAWGRERHVMRTPLSFGRHVLASRGGASGHQSNPFLAVCDAGADEESGTVFAVALAYSGNFQAVCDVDQFDTPRLAIGLNRYRGRLEAGESFDTPTAVFVTSGDGFGGMSRSFHRMIREGVLPSRWRREPRRVIINSWEAMYFQVNRKSITRLAGDGKAIGAELLVLDDGWFSGRRDDTSSLGDWWPNRERFPDGLRPVAEAVRNEGVEFGIWLEPEMVSPDSELYRAHPEWALQIPGRESTLSRSQLTLDLSNPEVEEHVYKAVSSVLEDSTASYVKWDMNRNMSEAGSTHWPEERQGEVMHRYILGFYRLLRRLNERFPTVLIESCAGGGGRFDLGLARFSPRFWTSDQSDAVERLDIQYGTSLVFPPEVIGSHVSTVPNHQMGRVTPARTRVETALPFSFGFELDPEREPEEDRREFLRGSQRFKELREFFQEGEFIRLIGPLTPGAERSSVAGAASGETAWMIASKEYDELHVFYYQPLERANYEPRRLRLRGAKPGTVYRDSETGERYDGAQLIHHGLIVKPGFGDYRSHYRHLRIDS